MKVAAMALRFDGDEIIFGVVVVVAVLLVVRDW